MIMQYSALERKSYQNPAIKYTKSKLRSVLAPSSFFPNNPINWKVLITIFATNSQNSEVPSPSPPIMQTGFKNHDVYFAIVSSILLNFTQRLKLRRVVYWLVSESYRNAAKEFAKNYYFSKILWRPVLDGLVDWLKNIGNPFFIIVHS